MHSSTATRPSTASADTGVARPRIGVLGVMQRLYDDDAARASPSARRPTRSELAAALGEVASRRRVAAGQGPRRRSSGRCASSRAQDLDGLLVVMLTYGPAMNVARALAETRLPVCVANTQPVGEVTGAWDMADLTYNQGIHGAQDTANALVRSGRPFGVVTGDWRSPSFVDARRALVARGGGRDALAHAQGRDLRLRDERDGRHPRRRPHAAHARSARRSTRSRRAPSTAPPARSTRRRRSALLDDEDAPLRDRPAARRARSARTTPGMQLGLERMLARGRLRRVLDALRRDRRRRPLRRGSRSRPPRA